jgi:hypothetical protein
LDQELVEQAARWLALGAVTQVVDELAELGQRLALAAGTAEASSGANAAANRLSLRRAPTSASRARVVWPMPRLGAPTARRKAGSSSSLAIRRR